jgi:hypothetical protein
LIAAHNADRLRASTHERYGKAGGAGETPSGCDWQYNWNAGQAIESTRRYDEHRPLALLLVTSGWIERDEIDVATLHQMISWPTRRLFCQMRSSRERRAAGLHCASNSSSE